MPSLLRSCQDNSCSPIVTLCPPLPQPSADFKTARQAATEVFLTPLTPSFQSVRRQQRIVLLAKRASRAKVPPLRRRAMKAARQRAKIAGDADRQCKPVEANMANDPKYSAKPQTLNAIYSKSDPSNKERRNRQQSKPDNGGSSVQPLKNDPNFNLDAFPQPPTQQWVMDQAKFSIPPRPPTRSKGAGGDLHPDGPQAIEPNADVRKEKPLKKDTSRSLEDCVHERARALLPKDAVEPAVQKSRKSCASANRRGLADPVLWAAMKRNLIQQYSLSTAGAVTDRANSSLSGPNQASGQNPVDGFTKDPQTYAEQRGKDQCPSRLLNETPELDSLESLKTIAALLPYQAEFQAAGLAITSDEQRGHSIAKDEPKSSTLLNWVETNVGPMQMDGPWSDTSTTSSSSMSSEVEFTGRNNNNNNNWKMAALVDEAPPPKTSSPKKKSALARLPCCHESASTVVQPTKANVVVVDARNPDRTVLPQPGRVPPPALIIHEQDDQVNSGPIYETNRRLQKARAGIEEFMQAKPDPAPAANRPSAKKADSSLLSPRSKHPRASIFHPVLPLGARKANRPHFATHLLSEDTPMSISQPNEKKPRDVDLPDTIQPHRLSAEEGRLIEKPAEPPKQTTKNHNLDDDYNDHHHYHHHHHTAPIEEKFQSHFLDDDGDDYDEPLPPPRPPPRATTAKNSCLHSLHKDPVFGVQKKTRPRTKCADFDDDNEEATPAPQPKIKHAVPPHRSVTAENQKMEQQTSLTATEEQTVEVPSVLNTLGYKPDDVPSVPHLPFTWKFAVSNPSSLERAIAAITDEKPERDEQCLFDDHQTNPRHKSSHPRLRQIAVPKRQSSARYSGTSSSGEALYVDKDDRDIDDRDVLRGLNIAVAAACSLDVDAYIRNKTGLRLRRFLADLRAFEILDEEWEDEVDQQQAKARERRRRAEMRKLKENRRVSRRIRLRGVMG